MGMGMEMGMKISILSLLLLNHDRKSKEPSSIITWE